MAAQYKTQCPHCQAQFRISEEHLKQAKGKVRCGSCLQVFLATDHLVDQPAATKPAAPVASKPVAKQPVAAAPKPPAAAKPAPTKPAATKPAATKPAPAAAPEKWTLPADEAKPAAPAAPASRWTMDEEGHDTEAFDDNDDFAEDEIPEARPQANDTKVSLGSIELSDSFMSLDEDGDERLRSEDFSDMAGAGRKGDKPGHDSDESWADKLLEELEEDKPPKIPTTADKMSLSETEEETRSQQNRQQKKKRRQEASPLDDLAEPDWAQDSPGAAFSNDDGFDFLNEADDDDVAAIELPRAEKKKVAPTIQFDSMIASGAEILRWGALSALMVALFALQYSSFHFDRLARTPEWRGFYSTVCNTFGCVLPNPSDLDNLRGANLVVRKHPVYSNALIVDVLLFNRASYEQPFPVLELGFTTLQGAAVASRRFTPAEYLNAELAKTNAMPIDTPVHVSLEILDPGAEAVNYTLRFFPAPQSGA